MASSLTMPTEAMVTIKVNYQGLPKRFKVPLRDMGVSTFEDKLRQFLDIPSTRLCNIERYSDSAGSYIVLDRANTSVYKQLYRAAKAKSKLKIRITDVIPHASAPAGQTKEDKQVPRPVTVEDEPEQAQAGRSESVGAAPVSVAQETPDPVSEAKPNSNESEAKVTATFRPGRFDSTEPIDFEQCLASLVKQQEGLKLELDDKLSSLHSLASYRASRLQPPTSDESAVETEAEAEAETPLAPLSRPWGDFRVCCNNCNKTIPDVHYHCTKCDDDDFDLCLSCVDQGVACYSSDHWLIKRFKKNGAFVSSTTETIAPKPKVKEPVSSSGFPCSTLAPSAPCTRNLVEAQWPSPSTVEQLAVFPRRTCNSCIRELAESKFMHCTTCEDFDLCTDCILQDGHGHHPKHGFVPAVDGSVVPSYVSAKLSPGRNQRHNAICDGCDKYVRGIRHKCLDCPDWDYCEDCIPNAKIVHPGHRFVPIYDPLTEVRTRDQCVRPVHVGICCDGPLCASRPHSRPPFITGIRYKCAVCDDTDFCANCEASPANTHNKTHPLIKFKTAVRNVTVSTMGERSNGLPMPIMGDRLARPSTSSRATETILSRQPSMNSIQTVAAVEPTEMESETQLVVSKPLKEEAVEVKELTEKPIPESTEEPTDKPKAPLNFESEKGPDAADLGAIYVRDTVTDGTILPTNHVFEQTWVLRNTGTVAWPAGCAVKFVGGDYMGHVDSNHPAGISELVSASESTVCYEALEVDKEFAFTVLLRTPARDGKIISYWRLTTQEGIKFGHRLWCDVNVEAPKVKEEMTPTGTSETSAPEVTEVSSQMIFPKLEKESPVSSIQDIKAVESEALSSNPPVQEDDIDDFDGCDEWNGSEEGFLTDEEYDILDASDEEYLEDQQKKLQKK